MKESRKHYSCRDGFQSVKHCLAQQLHFDVHVKEWHSMDGREDEIGSTGHVHRFRGPAFSGVQFAAFLAVVLPNFVQSEL